MAHPSCSADHELNSGKICAPCGQKVTNLRNVTGNLEVLLKNIIDNTIEKTLTFPDLYVTHALYILPVWIRMTVILQNFQLCQTINTSVSSKKSGLL